MRKTLITAAALTVIAMPAFAQSFDPDVGTGNILDNQAGASAYAQTPDYEDRYSRAQAVRRAQTVRRMQQLTHRAGGTRVIRSEDGND